MAGNQVTLTFAGDSKSLERTFDRVGQSAKGMAADMDKASGDVSRFGSSMDGVNSTVDASEGKFMGAADLLDGLGGAFGLPTEAATNMARSFADLAGGFSSVLGPAITGLLTKVGILTTATATQTAATGAATAAQTSLNLAFLANPITLVVGAIVALGAAFVVAWKNSETFRNVVTGALNWIGDAAFRVVEFFTRIPDYIMGTANAVKDAVIWPYKSAFNLIAKLWNNTVGRLSFEIPSWVPGLGGKGFSMPQLPTFHMGGIVPGNPGTPTPIMALAGERVVRAGDNTPQTTVVKLVVDGRTLANVVASNQRVNTRRGYAGA